MNYNKIINSIQEVILNIDNKLDDLIIFEKLFSLGARSIGKKTNDISILTKNEIDYLVRVRKDLVSLYTSLENKGGNNEKNRIFKNV